MRRALLVLFAVDCTLGAIAACGGFSGENSASSEGGADASADHAVTVTTDSGDSGDSGDAGMCTGFDASVFPTSGTVLCDGVARALDSDSNNCGACDHTCLGAVCAGGVCVPEQLVGGISSVTTVGLSGASIDYFAANTGVVLESPRGAASLPDAAVELAEIGDAQPSPQNFYGLALDEAGIYATTYDELAVVLFANAPTTFSPLVGLSNNSPKLVATDGVRLAYTDTSTFAVVYKDGGLVASIPNMSGASDLAVTPDHRYFFYVANNILDAGAAVDQDGAPLTRGTLYRWATASQELTVMASYNTPNQGSNGARSKIAADDFNVYFSDGIDGSIYALGVDTSGKTPPTLVSQAHGRFVGEIVTDASNVYFTAAYDDTNSAYSISRVSKCGGAETTYVDGHGGPTGENYRPAGLLTDDQYLYWGALEGVYRVAK